MRRDVTMLELVTAVTEHTRTEGEAIATIVHMVNSGAVRLAALSAAHVSTLNLPHHVTTLWCQRPGSRGDTAERDPSRRRAYARGHLDATQRPRTALRLADKGHLTAAAPRFSPANPNWAGRCSALAIAVPTVSKGEL